MSFIPNAQNILPTKLKNNSSDKFVPTSKDILKVKNNYEMPNIPFVNRPPTFEENSSAMLKGREALKGAAQSFLNTPEEAANIFGKSMYNKFNFAPKTDAAKIGGIAGDLGSYFMPSSLVTGGLKTASLIPKAKGIIDAYKLGLKTKPLTNALLTGAKNAGEAALFQKEKQPESTGIDVAKATGIGAGIPIALSAVSSANPIVSLIAKLGLGGALGYQQGGNLQSTLEGAGAAVTIPKMLKELGVGAAPVSTEFLTQPQNAMAKSRYEAGNRLETPLRPSEAFNSSAIARKEGLIPRSEVGGEIMSNLGEERLSMQNKAINNLLKTIYPKTKKSANEISTLYKKSYRNNLTQNAMHDLAEDPVYSKASMDVLNEPAYAKDLKKIRPNNFAYLDQVKRKLDDMAGSAERSGEGNKARIYGDSARNLTKVMDNVDSTYAQAREAAQKQITRRGIEKAMQSKALTGSNFFNTLLRNDNKFDDLLSKIKNNPEATRQLKDMKLAWEHLIGTETPRAAAGSSARSMTSAREEMSALWNKYKDTIGAPRDIERAKFIHDPKWWDKFDEVMKYKNKMDRQEAVGKLISRGISAGSLVKAKVNRSENQNR